MNSSVLNRRVKAGIRWRRSIKVSRGVGELIGLVVREGAPWLVEVNICRE